MTLRRWIAKKLYPEAFEDAERYHCLRDRVSELWQWCSYDFPALGKGAKWALHATRVRFMKQSEFMVLTHMGKFDEATADSIDRFRDKLRHEFPPSPKAPQ